MNQSAKADPFKIPKIVWSCLVASLVSYTIIVYILAGTLSFALPDFNNSLELVFVVVAGVDLAMAIFIPRILVRASKAAPGDPTDSRHLMNRVYVPWLIRMVLLTSIAIYGLVLAFTGFPSKFLFFMFVSLGGLLMSFPSEEKLRALAQ